MMVSDEEPPTIEGVELKKVLYDVAAAAEDCCSNTLHGVFLENKQRPNLGRGLGLGLKP